MTYRPPDKGSEVTAHKKLRRRDEFVRVRAASGPIRITLADASKMEGREVIVKKTGAANVRVSARSSQTIDGSTTPVVITDRMGVSRFRAAGGSWWVV